MKNNILYLCFALIVLASCKTEQVSPASSLVMDELPQGLELNNVIENYDAGSNTYSLRFTVKNNSGEAMQMPSIESDVYSNNAVVALATQKFETIGAGESREANMKVIAASKPSKVVFHYQDAPLYGLQF